MGRSLRIPGLVDLIQADVRSDIRGLADDTRLDRSFAPRGPLINRILVQRIRSVLRIDGMPLPSVAPRGDAQRLRAQDILRRLGAGLGLLQFRQQYGDSEAGFGRGLLSDLHGRSNLGPGHGA